MSLVSGLNFVSKMFPGAAERMRQHRFNFTLTSMVDQGYAGAFVAAQLMEVDGKVYKFEGVIPEVMTIDTIMSELKRATVKVFGQALHYSEIHVMDKQAVAMFNRKVYFEMELTSKAFMIISNKIEIVEHMQEFLRVVVGKKLVINTIMLTDQGIGVNYKEYAVSKLRMPENCFYPYLHMPMEYIWEEFMNSQAPLLIVYGPAGTGKTTFGRGLAVAHSDVVYSINNSKVFNAADPFAPYYADTTSKLAMIEEVDQFIGPRSEAGNGSGNIVASLNNYLQGLSDDTDHKIVLNVNLTQPTTQIDEALMRPGRCYDVLKFSNLTQKEAESLAEEKGIDKFFDAPIRDHWSLAEVLNFKPTRKADVGQAMGFVG